MMVLMKMTNDFLACLIDQAGSKHSQVIEGSVRCIQYISRTMQCVKSA